MSSVSRYSNLSDGQLQIVHEICDKFEQAIRDDGSLSIEEQLADAPTDVRDMLFRELLDIELESRIARGDSPSFAEYEGRFPNRLTEMRHAFSESCNFVNDEMPAQIGRYRIDSLLGSGGFANVYLGYDEELKRQVAIKVPLPQLVSKRADVANYLNEAQTLANLDHPNIVPVHDIGRNEEFPCFVVSKHIEGTDLAQFLKQNRLSWRAAAVIARDIADALHFAHTNGFVHRDVKPGNILLDSQQVSYLSDFGLASNELDAAEQPRFAGTPAYMSPEQSRGESHRVDGRSDIYSLGAVLYEMLTGRRTHSNKSRLKLLSEIAKSDPKPPRQINDSIPKDLERICLKALARRVRERYTTAMDLADELRYFLEECESETIAPTTTSTKLESSGTVSEVDSTSSTGDSRDFPITPRGLRSFDENDSDFFLSLLPGPRGRDGLPTSIQFWKTRIEATDADKTFQIGLIYGSSGSGKSSILKAGLMPRLSPKVAVTFVEATAEQTESRLLGGLRKQFSELPNELNLKDTISALRRGHYSHGRKVLIVLDQFEQWLHANLSQQGTELVDALRQCDGSKIQCLVLVRDDFWLAVSRFMQELEIDLISGHNVGLVDLFDQGHAQKVLNAFGRAFGRLPNNKNEQSFEQRQFVEEAIQELKTTDRKVACVRIALFAEMMKDKAWTPGSLRELGGIRGLGVAFLDETFINASANPAHRFHRQPARQVLKALLPEAGIEIKGRMRSYGELIEVADYQDRPKDFAELIRILDQELCLISPTELETLDVEKSSKASDPSRRDFQLSHDYMVPSLREWLTQKQKETWRGRAELHLNERSVEWNSKPESRQLPSLAEWFSIRNATDKQKWTPQQTRMMKHASHFYGFRLTLGMVAATIFAMGIWYTLGATQKRNLLARIETAVESMANSQGVIVSQAIKDLNDYPNRLVIDELQSRFTDSDVSQLPSLGFALAHFGASDPEFLASLIADSPAVEVENLRVALQHSREQSIELLRQKAAAPGCSESLRQRIAVIALGLGDPAMALEYCRLRPDPISRTNFVELLSSWRGDDNQLSRYASTVDDPALRSGLCMAIGGTPHEQMNQNAKQVWQPVFANWYLNDNDSGVHSAAGWALRTLQLELPNISSSRLPTKNRAWHLNSVGMTMIALPGGSFVRQELPSRSLVEQAKQKVTLTRPFLISDREVSRGLFQRYMEDPDYPDSEKRKHEMQYFPITPTDDHPILHVDWIEAVKFCNWLSHLESLQPCYQQTGKIWDLPTDGPREEWRLIDNANGYRLPTEAEWEYASRAGTTTQFSFGGEMRLANRYLVYATDRPEKCGSKLPNGWGGFDFYGNVEEWCEDWKSSFDSSSEVTDPKGPEREPLLFKVVRGGNFRSGPTIIDTRYRGRRVLSRQVPEVGFRVVRTYSPSSNVN